MIPERLDAFVKRVRTFLDAVTFDDSGRMVAGQWMGGNGGLLSRETIKEGDLLRAELEQIEKLYP